MIDPPDNEAGAAAGRITLTYLVFGLAFLVATEALASGAEEGHTPVRFIARLLFLAASGTMITLLVGRELRRRRRAELRERDTRHGLDALGDVAAALGDLPVDELLEQLLFRVARALDVDAVAVLAVEPGGALLRVVASHGQPAPVGEVPVQGTVAGHVLRAGGALQVDVGLIETRRESVCGLASVIGAPAVVEGHVRGVVYAGTIGKRRFDDRDRQLMEVVASRLASVLRHRELFESEHRARLAAEHARAHLALQARAAEILAPALEDGDTAVGAVAAAIVPDFADIAVVLLVDEGQARVVGIRHTDPTLEAKVGALLHAQGWLDLAVDVASCGESALLFDGATASDWFLDHLRSIGAVSAAAVPIELAGQARGLIVAATLADRRGFRPSDVTALGALALRCATALERVGLHNATRDAALAVERRAQRLRRLAESGAQINSALSVDGIVELLATSARHTLEADGARVVVSTGTDGPSELVVGDSLGAEGRCRLRVDLADSSGYVEVGRRSAAAFNDDDAMVLASLAHFGSISLANVRLYQAVVRSERRLTAIVDQSPVGIIELDDNRGLIGANAAARRILGAVDGDLALPPELLTSFDAARNGVGTHVEAVIAEISTNRADGVPIELSVSAALVPSGTGSRDHLLGVVTDITERRRAQLEVEQSQRLEALGHMAGAVAHDYNNLLTVILGYTNLVLRRLDDDDRSRTDLLAVHRAAEQASKLADQLLTLSRRRVVQPEIVDPDAVITSLEGVLRRLVGGSVELVITGDGGGRHAEVDPGQLEQVLLNLTINARDAMPSGGKLTIATGPGYIGPDARPAVAVRVSDTGLGMDDATRARCFEPYFTTKSVAGGAGLGLATVHAIVSQAGGELSVTSEHGRGSSFTILLACVGADAIVQEVPCLPDEGSETVLFVEDEAAVRAFGRAVLEEHRYTVIEAADGPAALELVRSGTTFDALVTDVVMPEMSGPALARHVTELRPSTPVLFISGFAQDPEIHGDGQLAFLPKPYSPEQLVGAVREVLSTASSGLEAVSRAADGVDPAGLVRDAFDLAPDPPDVLGDGGRVLPIGRRSPDLLEDLLAAEDLSR